MLDEGNALNMMETPDAPPPEEKSNRTFLIVGGILAGLVLLTLVCIVLYLFVIRPRTASQQQSNATQAAAIMTQNAQSIQNATLTAQAELWTPTLLPTSTSTPTSIPLPTGSPTPVIAMSSPIATATSDPAIMYAAETQLADDLTATAAALPTRALGGDGMPSTGFFDDFGLPSMIILALALVVVIFLARRMRKSTAK
jgi:ABC-type antimicrobial peptide transport system permease subunit